MKLIIDGYNLLFAITKLPDAEGEALEQPKRVTHSETNKEVKRLEQAREKLIRIIGLYNQHRKYKITIIFDGTESSNTHRHSPEIEIIFSGKDQDADEVIIQLAKEHPDPREVTVITADRYIQQQLKPTGIKVISSGDFINELNPVLSRAFEKSGETTEPKGKLFGISPEEADEWLKLFGEIN